MLNGQIAKGALISYIAIFLNIAITFFYTPWMIRKIGVSDYGLYSLTSTFIAYFIIDFGLSGAITRFIAKYRAECRQDKIENILGLTTKLYLFIDAIIFVILFVCYFFLSNIFKGLTLEELEKLKVLFVIAGTFSVLSFVFHPMNGAMMAYEFFVENKLIDMFQRVGSVLLIVAALLFDGNVYELVFILGTVSFLSALLKYIVFKKKTRIRINWSFFDSTEMKVLLTFSFWVFINSLAQGLRLTMMPTVLGARSNSTEISIFAIGMTIEAMVFNFSNALSGLFLPKVTRLVCSDNGVESVTKLMIKVGRLQLFVISLILLGFTLIGENFIRLWLGENFHFSYYVVLLLTLFNYVSLTQSVAVDFVYAENRMKYVALLTLGSSIISLCFAILLAPNCGALGCAIAFCLAMSFNQVLINIFYKKKLNLGIGAFFKECHFKILPPLIVVTGLFLIAKRFLTVGGWLQLFLFTVAFVVVFVFVTYFYLLNDEEKQILKITKR